MNTIQCVKSEGVQKLYIFKYMSYTLVDSGSSHPLVPQLLNFLSLFWDFQSSLLSSSYVFLGFMSLFDFWFMDSAFCLSTLIVPPTACFVYLTFFWTSTLFLCDPCIESFESWPSQQWSTVCSLRGKTQGKTWGCSLSSWLRGGNNWKQK